MHHACYGTRRMRCKLKSPEAFHAQLTARWLSRAFYSLRLYEKRYPICAWRPYYVLLYASFALSSFTCELILAGDYWKEMFFSGVPQCALHYSVFVEIFLMFISRFRDAPMLVFLPYLLAWSGFTTRFWRQFGHYLFAPRSKYLPSV